MKTAADAAVAGGTASEGGTTTAANATRESEPEAKVEEAPMVTSAGAPGGSLLERVRQACKDTDKQLSGLLNGSCEVKSEEEDVVTLGFYHTFHLERIESGPYAQRLEELFSTVLGRAVKIAFEHAPRERAASTSRGGHLVQAARELGAKPIGSRSIEGGDGDEPRRDEP
jgi:hypothetical protein